MKTLTRPTVCGKFMRRIPVARQQVIEVNCSRCGNKEYLPVTETKEGTVTASIALDLFFLGEAYQFEDLCSRCRKTCANYVKALVKDVKSSRHKAKKRGPAKQDPVKQDKS